MYYNTDSSSNFDVTSFYGIEYIKEVLINRIDGLEQKVKSTCNFDKIELKENSSGVYVLATDSTTDSQYYLSITDIPSLSKDSLNGTTLTINQNGHYLTYTGDNAEEMFEEIPKLLREMDWRNNSIHSPVKYLQ